MLVLRILGVWSLLVAMISLTIDGTRTIAGSGALIVTSLDEQWRQLHSASWTAARDALTDIHPALWDVVSSGVLAVPTWLFFGLLGILLYWLGRRRTRINVYSN
ncbi:MAG: hypothetical protein AB7U38_01055 [Hyphomicrobiales bacterium]